MNAIAKYLKPGASDDLNKFLESIPEHVGKMALIAAGIAWASAAALGLYTMIQTQELAKLRTDLEAASAVKPVVPTIKKTAVKKHALEKQLKSVEALYKGLDFRVNKNKVTIISKSLGGYPQFREAIGHIANLERGWVASLESLCVGRDCTNDKLIATVSLETISVQ